MRLNFLMLMGALILAAMCGMPARAQKKPFEKVEKKERAEQKKVKVVTMVEREERAMAVEPGAVIILCMESGKITVRGSDRREVRAQVPKGTHLDFHRAADAAPENPARRLEVLVSEEADDDTGEPHFEQCSGSADLELDVPRDVTLFFKSKNGDFDIDSVAEARIETISGKISMSHITRAVEATSVDGDLSLTDSSGRVRLETFGGSVEATNISKVAEGDFFKARSINNDVVLENVNHSRVEVSTISGEITMRGPLARAGRYDLKTTSGDITLTMPADSSFQLAARVSENGEIITDFPLKYTGGVSSVSLLSAGRMIGTYGKGDATINLISFNGTLRLRKQ
jgi:hypothetical protein